MTREMVPPLPVQTRLFVDRWWRNGGDAAEAVEYAGYDGYPTPSSKAKKGRRMLASKAVKAYVAYLHRAQKAEAEAAEKRRALVAAKAAAEAVLGTHPRADQKTGQNGTIVADNATIKSWGGGIVADEVKQSQQEKDRHIAICQPIEEDSSTGEGIVVESAIGADESGVVRPGASRSHMMNSLDAHQASSMMLPPDVLVPADAALRHGRELTPVEVREILANIARGNETGMRDPRVRMKAIELAMRNLGMLVDLSVKASIDGAEKRKAMTSEERDAEIAKIERHLAEAKTMRLK